MQARQAYRSAVRRVREKQIFVLSMILRITLEFRTVKIREFMTRASTRREEVTNIVRESVQSRLRSFILRLKGSYTAMESGKVRFMTTAAPIDEQMMLTSRANRPLRCIFRNLILNSLLSEICRYPKYQRICTSKTR